MDCYQSRVIYSTDSERQRGSGLFLARCTGKSKARREGGVDGCVSSGVFSFKYNHSFSDSCIRVGYVQHSGLSSLKACATTGERTAAKRMILVLLKFLVSC